MEGLNGLLQKLYDVTMEVEEPAPGELWANDVYKLAGEHVLDCTSVPYSVHLKKFGSQKSRSSIYLDKISVWSVSTISKLPGWCASYVKGAANVLMALQEATVAGTHFKQTIHPCSCFAFIKICQ